MDLRAGAAGIGALVDDTRRALYEYVVAQAEPVGREQAAAALGIAQHNVNFHLDRLVSEGLLEVEYRRLSGRSGPGAGRPSKLYRRSSNEFTVSLPPRHYDVVGDLLARAVTRAAGGERLAQAIEDVAHEAGQSIGEAERRRSEPPLEGVARVLAAHGYDPTVDSEEVVLTNCPFDALAKKHTDLVCGLNRDFVQGIAEGLGHGKVSACLAPEEGRCCVKARLEPSRRAV